MAIPNGSGTEVLKRFYANLTSGSDLKVLDGVANHIYIFTSIIICNTLTAAATFGMHIQVSAGTNPGELWYLLGPPTTADAEPAAGSHVLGGQETFVFNERWILYSADELIMNGSSSSDIDVWGTYIDQDWT